MSDFKVDVKINQAEIKKITGRLQNVEPPLKTIARKQLAKIEGQFRSQTDPDGNKWSALKPSTLRTKKVNRDKILTRTGTLSQSFQSEVNRNSLRIFSNSDYAIYHQTGTVKMDQRKIVGFSNEDWGEIRKQLKVWISRKNR